MPAYRYSSSFFLFFELALPPVFYTLSLHDALPIWILVLPLVWFGWQLISARLTVNGHLTQQALLDFAGCTRSEEHTSELQSLTNLVCRLLLEKKKKKTACKTTA